MTDRIEKKLEEIFGILSNEISLLKDSVCVLLNRGHSDFRREQALIDGQSSVLPNGYTLNEINEKLTSCKLDQHNGLEKELRDSGGLLYDKIWLAVFNFIANDLICLLGFR